MVPYLDLPTFGPVNSFGVLVVLGLLFGVTAALRHAEKLGLDLSQVHRMAAYCGIGGLLGAHYVDLFLYQPGWADKDGAVWTFLNPFAGISSYGGLIGGTIGFLLFARSRDLARKRLRYADVGVLGVIVLLTFGRAGCASVHDHIGVASSFALAVDFPAGNPAGVVGPHHDLGLYELALFLVLLPVAVMLLRTPRRPGWLVGVAAASYAVPRFFLDHLRRESSDPRYGGLTPAQWSCLVTLAIAIGVFVWIYRRREPPPESYLAATPWRTHLRELFRLRASPRAA
jgi:phosphatidylglycerol:prolipoprotein diacylglycerol transferase